MRRCLSSHFLLVVTLLTAVPVSGAAQPDSLQIPMDLALALLGGQGSDTRILVGAAPADVGGSIPLGAVERVVGGIAGETGSTVVVQVPGDAPQALADYFEHLQSQGWQRATTPVDERGGFQQTRPLGQSTWCGDSHLIRASSTSFASRTYLRISYATRLEGRDPCDILQAPSMSRRDPFRALEFPTLESPPGADVRAEGRGGSPNGISMEASIVSQLGAEPIFEHYAQQLTAAGWVLEGQATGDGIAVGRWRTQDAEGAAVTGTMVIWSLADADSYRASLRLDRREQRR